MSSEFEDQSERIKAVLKTMTFPDRINRKRNGENVLFPIPDVKDAGQRTIPDLSAMASQEQFDILTQTHRHLDEKVEVVSFDAKFGNGLMINGLRPPEGTTLKPGEIYGLDTLENS